MTRSTKTPRRSLALLGALPFVALGLAACGDDEPIAPDPGDTNQGPETDESPETDTDDQDGPETDTDDQDGPETDTDDQDGPETDPDMDTDTDTDNGGGAPGVFTAEAGDCLDTTVPDQVLDCSEPHDAEVFYTFNVDDADSFPGEDAMQQEAVDGCFDPFIDYFDSDPNDSDIELTALYPSSGTWDMGDREIICLGYVDEQLTESLEGSGQ